MLRGAGEPGRPGAPRSPFPPHPVGTLGLGSSSRTARLCVVAPSRPLPTARHKSEERRTGQPQPQAPGDPGSMQRAASAGLGTTWPGQVPRLFGLPQLGEGLRLFSLRDSSFHWTPYSRRLGLIYCSGFLNH